MNEKLDLENNKVYENIKIYLKNSENESEDNFSDLKTLNKGKLRKIKEKDIKFNIKRNNKNFDKHVNKNDKNDKRKIIEKGKRKNEQSNEERKMKDRTSILNKSFFERKNRFR